MILPILCGRCFKPLRQVLLPHFFVHARLMLLPIIVLCGRCYTTWFLQCIELADVIAKWLVDLTLHKGTWLNCHYMKVHGWCYCKVADGIATAGWWLADVIASRQMLFARSIFNFSSEMLNRTSSQMCGRWYLPIFLFRNGSLTLTYRPSLMVFMRFWSSLPTISKFSILMLWPVVLWWSNMGDGAFWCSLDLSPKVLEDSPIYSSEPLERGSKNIKRPHPPYLTIITPLVISSV